MVFRTRLSRVLHAAFWAILALQVTLRPVLAIQPAPAAAPSMRAADARRAPAPVVSARHHCSRRRMETGHRRQALAPGRVPPPRSSPAAVHMLNAALPGSSDPAPPEHPPA